MSTIRNQLRKQALVLAIAGAVGIAGAAQAAATPYSTLTKATALSKGDVVSGSMALSQPVHVTMSLKLRNQAGLNAFMEKVANPATPASQRTMSQAQMAANYLPTAAQVQSVVNFLKGAGFTNIHTSSNNLLVSADGTAAVAQAAFKTNMVNVHTHDGRNAFGNSSAIQVPTSLQGTVQAVLGLQNVHIAHVMGKQQPVQTQAAGGVTSTSHYPVEFQYLYDAVDLPAATDMNVGIITVGDMTQTQTDFASFLSTFGDYVEGNNTLAVECVPDTVGGSDPGDGNCSSWGDQGTVEWDLDSQDIAGMSGGVNSITFYAAQDFSGTGLIAAINQAVTENTASVIDMSIGGCERYSDINQGGDGSAQTADAIFETAAATNGQTFSISTGDDGSDECGDGKTNSASWPASSPWVIAAGGTTLNTNRQGNYYSETSWNGGGGSPSSFEPAQSWQTPVLKGATARGLPDIAFDGDPQSGSNIIVDGGFQQWGGTSLAAPLFTGAWARILEATGRTGADAFAAPHLYSLSGTSLHDVVRGSNGQYRAGVGYDYTTGLGSLDVYNAAMQLGEPE